MIKSYPEFYNKRYKYEKYAQHCQEQQENQPSTATIPLQDSASSSHASNLVINTSSSIDDSSEHSPSPSSPASLQPSNSTPAMHPNPLSSITNKLNAKPIDFAAAYGANCMSNNYYQAQNYENFANIHSHFQSHLGPFSGYNSAAHHHHQATAPFLQQSQYYANNTANSANHRNSTGGSSANSSTASLNSPPSAVSDENSPLHNSIFSNQMNSLQPNHQPSQSQPQHQIQPHQNSHQQQQNSRFTTPYNMGQHATSAISTELPPLPPNLSTPTINSSLLRISSSSSNTSMTSEDDDGSGMSLKKRRPVPVENKDNTYWEKRRKNNESAKRSRDIRRSKEEHISIRVIYLEQENLQLRTEVALLRNEAEKLRAMLYANNGGATGASNCNGNLINSNNGR